MQLSGTYQTVHVHVRFSGGKAFDSALKKEVGSVDSAHARCEGSEHVCGCDNDVEGGWAQMTDNRFQVVLHSRVGTTPGWMAADEQLHMLGGASLQGGDHSRVNERR